MTLTIHLTLNEMELWNQPPKWYNYLYFELVNFHTLIWIFHPLQADTSTSFSPQLS